MERRLAQRALRQIRTLYSLGALGGLTDAQLLELYLARRGEDAEDAFAALVHRHAPMVLGVCRRMLPCSHDAEDAFQAAFLILARKAASIGRRERLASWLHGVAVRTASETRRRDARQRAKEKRSMEVRRARSMPAEDGDDLRPLLDEELNRLPRRYRAALVACDLEGKTRIAAARELGLPEATLSTHVARGRKLLRERLLRRGVSLGVGPAAGLPRPGVEARVGEHLMQSTIRAAPDFASESGGAGTVPVAVASLAKRMINIMFLTRLSALFVPVVAAGTVAAVLGLIAMAAGPLSDPKGAGQDALSGRIRDEAGAAVAGAKVWAVGGRWDEPEAVAAATADGQGTFVLSGAWNHPAAREALDGGRFGLLARAPDGRVGWLATLKRGDALANKAFEIVVGPVGEVRGRLVDPVGRPIAGASIAPVEYTRPGGPESSDSFKLNPEAADPYIVRTDADGSFALKDVPRGGRLKASFVAEGYGDLRLWWDTTRPLTVTLDDRFGSIRGRIRLPAAFGRTGQMTLFAQLRESPGNAAAPPDETQHFRAVTVGENGSFQMNKLPPGRYRIDLGFGEERDFTAVPGETITVGPGADVELIFPRTPLATLTGRILDAETGRGIAGIAVRYYRSENGAYRKVARQALTDAEGRYAIAAASGRVKILPENLPRAYLVPRYRESPDLDVNADRPWPDLKLAPATALDGVVVDENEHPVVGAEVYVLQADRGGHTPTHAIIRTGPGGTFHVDQLDPDDAVSFWARTKVATTDGAHRIRPRDVAGKVRLTIDPNFGCRIRGRVTDGAGRRLPGAKVNLWWNRPYADEFGRIDQGHAIIVDTQVTGADGWFVFRGLWRGSSTRATPCWTGTTRPDSPRSSASPARRTTWAGSPWATPRLTSSAGASAPTAGR